MYVYLITHCRCYILKDVITVFATLYERWKLSARNETLRDLHPNNIINDRSSTCRSGVNGVGNIRREIAILIYNYFSISRMFSMLLCSVNAIILTTIYNISFSNYIILVCQGLHFFSRYTCRNISYFMQPFIFHMYKRV